MVTGGNVPLFVLKILGPASESLLGEDALPFYIFPALGSFKFKTTRDLGELHFQILETPHNKVLFSTLGVQYLLLNSAK